MLIVSIERFYGDNPQPYLTKLYGAMLTSGYFGLLRVGEMTFSDHTIKAKDVHIGHNKNKILFILHSSKTHGKYAHPQTVKISEIQDGCKTQDDSKKSQNRIPQNDKCCPFQLLQQYLAIRPKYRHDHNQFFVFSDRSPVKPVQFNMFLRKLIAFNQLDASRYSAHGLCAGQASDLYAMGIPVDTIKKLGRWKSNAVFKYIKI